ncbi:hypothetical protein NpPPO83_00006739 [Neofusicoccum parvum]|uniref:Uncharacterized protein n=1 Tax=Neofusicoccum parvum TaxID=310453 RepID=A0ACB5S7Y2_9PEZI|nr:hypothetical protein NpPPO83_00006739 [Neofusicoccum parvum]
MSRNYVKQLHEEIDEIPDDKLDYGDYMRASHSDKSVNVMKDSASFHMDFEAPVTEPKDTKTRDAGSYYKCNIQIKNQGGGKKSKQSSSMKSGGNKNKSLTNQSGTGQTLALVLVHSSLDKKPPKASMMKFLLKMSSEMINNYSGGTCEVLTCVVRKDRSWVNESTGKTGMESDFPDSPEQDKNKKNKK